MDLYYWPISSYRDVPISGGCDRGVTISGGLDIKVSLFQGVGIEVSLFQLGGWNKGVQLIN